MSRKQALLRLHQRLTAQRDELRKKIAEDLGLAYTPDDGANALARFRSRISPKDASWRFLLQLYRVMLTAPHVRRSGQPFPSSACCLRRCWLPR